MSLVFSDWKPPISASATWHLFELRSHHCTTVVRYSSHLKWCPRYVYLALSWGGSGCCEESMQYPEYVLMDSSAYVLPGRTPMDVCLWGHTWDLGHWHSVDVLTSSRDSCRFLTVNSLHGSLRPHRNLWKTVMQNINLVFAHSSVCSCCALVAGFLYIRENCMRTCARRIKAWLPQSLTQNKICQ